MTAEARSLHALWWRGTPGPDRIKEVLAEHPILKGLGSDILDGVARKVEVLRAPLGEVIFRQGDPGSGFYIIASGRVRVLDDSDPRNPVTLSRLGSGIGFGERSLLFDLPVSATIRASTKTVLIKLGIDTFNKILADFPQVRGDFEKAVESLGEFSFLRIQPFAASLDRETLRRLMGLMTLRTLAPNDTLQPAAGQINLVYQGRFSLSGNVGERAVLINYRRPGDLIGLNTLLGVPTLPVTVKADTECQVMSFPVDRMQEMLRDHPELWDFLRRLGDDYYTQQKTFLDSLAHEDAGPDGAADTLLAHEPVADGGRFFGTTYPLVRTPYPNLSGAACLVMAASWLSHPINEAKLVEKRIGRQDPEDLFSMGRAIEESGFLTRLLKIDPSHLQKIVAPAVVLLEDGTPVTIFAVTDKIVVLGNPSEGLQRIPRQAFVELWKGELLSISVVPDFADVGDSTAGMVRQFLPMLRPHAKTFFHILTLTFLMQALATAAPLFTQQIIDRVLAFQDWNLLYLMLGAILATTTMQAVSRSIRGLLMTFVGLSLSGTLILRFFTHILAVPISRISRWRVGDIIVRFEENEKILALISQTGGKVIVDGFSILIFGAMLLWIAPSMALLGFGALAVMGAILYRFAPQMRQNDQRVFERREQLQSHLIEMVGGIETIKSLSQEAYFSQRGDGILNRIAKEEFQGARLSFNIELLTVFLNEAVYLLVLWVGALIVLGGDGLSAGQGLSAGELIAFSGLMGAMMVSGRSLCYVYDDLLQMKISLERVKDILDLPREPRDAVALCPVLRGEVRFQDVHFSYTPGEGDWILSNLDFTIRPGLKVALVGPSGSGKTTMVKMINRLLDPTEGKIFLDGLDISQLEISSLRQQIGVVEQSPYIFSGSIRDNIAKSQPGLPLKRVVWAARLAGADDFIKQFPMGYDTKIGEGGRSLSGGQAQRLIIARAVASNPSLLIMDEATAALDNQTERIIQTNIDAIFQGRTAFIIAHRMSTIRNADLILVMDRGQIVEQGDHDSLMKQQGLYHQLVQASKS